MRLSVVENPSMVQIPGLPDHRSLGTLMTVAIHIDPYDLESLLDALAQVGFPINPQIYLAPASPQGGLPDRPFEPFVAVEFPAYADQIGDLRRTLSNSGFDTGHKAACH